MPRPGEDRSDVGGAAQFNNIGPVPLSVFRGAVESETHAVERGLRNGRGGHPTAEGVAARQEPADPGRAGRRNGRADGLCAHGLRVAHR